MDNQKYKKKSDYNQFNEKILELENKIRLLYNFIFYLKILII